jgi:hypothetical protein
LTPTPPSVFEESGGDELAVANHLGGEAEARAACEESIFGILFEQGGGDL